MNDTTEDAALVVRVPRACEMLAVSKPTLYKLMREGAIRGYCDGVTRKFEVASLKAYVAKRIAEDGGRSK